MGDVVLEKPPLGCSPALCRDLEPSWCLGSPGNLGSVISGSERDKSDKSWLLPDSELVFSQVEVSPAPGAGVLSEAGVLREKSKFFLKYCLQPNFLSLRIWMGKRLFLFPPSQKLVGSVSTTGAPFQGQDLASICSIWEIKAPKWRKKVALGPRLGTGFVLHPKTAL